jgi:DNA-directed RNA polymerase specialized sigma24 family protein
MSVDLEGGSTRDQGIADVWRENGEHVFARLYETFAASLYDYCADVLDDAIAACDVVQDSLVAVDARITALPDPARLRVSLYAEARRRCLRKRSGPAAAPPGAGEAPAPEQTPGPDDLDLGLRGDGAAGADGETRSMVTAALAMLPDRDREALNLAFRHNIAGPDLAEVVGISPHRARSLLHAASARFGQAAAVVAAAHQGPAGCRTLLGLAGQQAPGAAPLTARLGERLGRHLDKCPDCALLLGGRSFGPELIGTVPVEPPVGRLRLRITRTALALGSYRVKAVDLPEAARRPEPPDRPAGPGAGPRSSGGPRSQGGLRSSGGPRSQGGLRSSGGPRSQGGPPSSGGPPPQGGRRRAALNAVAASSVAIAVLGMLGGLVLPNILSGNPRPAAKAVSGVQPSPAASPAPDPAAPGQARSGSRHPIPALPLLGPAPVGVLPTGSTAPSGSSPAPSRTSPAPARSASPSPKRSPTPTPPHATSPPPVTPPPTTPPPTTPPPPTPTPSSTTIG